MKSSQFNEKAMKEGFIVVYPEGTGPIKHLFLTWNARHCCASAMKNKIDDVGFTSDLIDKLVNQYPVDPKRVYATGLSNGGMMTNRVGEELSNKVAAIGPIVATLFGDEKLPVKPVAAIIFNGALDEHVKEEGGFGGARFGEAWDQTTTPLKVESQAVFWAKANGGSAKPTQVENTATVRHLHYACPQNRNVDMYILKDQGHAWPGGLQGGPKGDIPSKSIRATDLMWDFFKQQTR
jgi:polyhydroxybutyrate depolymerase